MSRKTLPMFIVSLMLVLVSEAPSAELAVQSGEALFQKNCAICHPKGGNIFNKEKTLWKKDREANGIMTAQDIIKKMRNPGAFDVHPNKFTGMTVFDARTLSESDAAKIADYILKTFD
ncbi:MAG TPA: c-type cytochrome [Thermodesulfovibrionales bacterium]|nr:c-type cytochrome [Thermodesulfovibrionales bacterium]